VVGFHFGHGHDEIGSERLARKPNFAEAAVARLQPYSAHLVPAEIDALDPLFPEYRSQTRGVDHEFRVSLMTGTFANHDAPRSEPQKTLSRSAD
jgi:hypothetical protein